MSSALSAMCCFGFRRTIRSAKQTPANPYMRLLNPVKATIQKPTITKYLTRAYASSTGAPRRAMLQPPLPRVKGPGVSSVEARRRPLPVFREATKNALRSPVYTGCKSASRRSAKGQHVIRDGKFWIPLIALYSGMRLGEIVQLLVGDIKSEARCCVLRYLPRGRREKADQNRLQQAPRPYPQDANRAWPFGLRRCRASLSSEGTPLRGDQTRRKWRLLAQLQQMVWAILARYRGQDTQDGIPQLPAQFQGCLDRGRST